MKRRLTSIAILWVWLFGAMLAWAEDSILEQIPDDALAVVVINDLTDLSGKIEKLAKQVNAPAPPPLLMLKSLTGIQEGLDETGSVALAILPADGAPAAAVLLAPVTDYAKFAAQLQVADADADISEGLLAGQSVLVGKSDDYAAITSPDFRAALQHVLDSEKDVSAQLEGIQEWLDDTDLCAAATPAGLKLALSQAVLGLEQAKAGFPADNEQAATVMKTLEAYQAGLGLLEKEATHLAIGLSIDDDGTVHLGSRMLFRKGGSIDTVAAKLTSPKNSLFTGLPAGPYAMAFAGTTPEAMFSKLIKFSVDMMKMNPLYGNLDAAQSEKLSALMGESVKDMQSVSMVMGAGKPGDSFYGNTVGLMKVKDSAAYLVQYKKMITAMGEVMQDPTTKAPMYAVRDLKVGGAPGLEVTMDASSLAQGPQAEQMKEMFDKMFGPGGKMNVYVAAADKTTIAMAYVSKEKLNQLLASYKSGKPGLASDADVVKTAEQLPEGSQWIGFVNPKGFLEFINVVVTTMMPPGGPQISLPPFPQTPPIGMGARLDAKGLETDVVIPAKMLGAIAGYAQQLQQQFQQAPAEDAL